MTNVSVLGTHCESCETRISEAWKTLPYIQKIEFTQRGNERIAHISHTKPLSYSVLAQLIQDKGYQLADQAELRGSSKSQVKRFFGWLAVILVVYLLLDWLGVFSYQVGATSPNSLWGVFVVGLIAAISSCAAVVGSLVFAASATHAKRHPHDTLKKRLTPHVLFNAGRLMGFAGFGALLGLLGEKVKLSPASNGFFILFVALIMLGLGTNLLGLLPRGRFPLSLPKVWNKRIHSLKNNEHPFSTFLLGSLTFFLPCGFTQSMQLFALTTGNWLDASLIMLVFAVGTLPALLGIGMFSSLSRGKLLSRVSVISGVLIFVLGVNQLTNAWVLLDVHLPNPTKPAPSQDLPHTGEQVIQMEVTSAGVYAPDVLEVTEGIPVRWQIYGAKRMGCADTLVMRAFDVATTLKPGPNEVFFTPTTPGTYTFSCSMGMVRGSLIVRPSS